MAMVESGMWACCGEGGIGSGQGDSGHRQAACSESCQPPPGMLGVTPSMHGWGSSSLGGGGVLHQPPHPHPSAYWGVLYPPPPPWGGGVTWWGVRARTWLRRGSRSSGHLSKMAANCGGGSWSTTWKDWGFVRWQHLMKPSQTLGYFHTWRGEHMGG